MDTYGGVDPRFFDLGNSWRRVVSFTPRPLYSRYPFDRRLIIIIIIIIIIMVEHAVA
jgi:hypothetical protein